jgi:hypothetical protein
MSSVEKEVVRSPDKLRYTIHSKHKEMLKGMKFFCIRNRHNSYVVPSNRNAIDGICIKKIKLDKGASSSIWPLSSSAVLSDLFSRYPENTHSFEIASFRTFGGPILCLRITRKDKEPCFDIHLGLDVYPVPQHTAAKNLMKSFAELEKKEVKKEAANKSPSGGVDMSDLSMYQPMCTMKRITFFLCTDDVNTIRNNAAMLSRFVAEEDVESLCTFARTDVERRDNALLGNDALHRSGCSAVTHCNVDFFSTFL